MNLSALENKATLPKVVTALILIFAMTHGWVVLSLDALYWDDWSILTSDKVVLLQMFKFVGFELSGYLHAWLVPLGAVAYKALMLFSLALMSVFVFLIARSYKWTVLQAGLITAMVIVAPLNTSKVASVNVIALLFAAIFFVAWWLLIRELQKPSLVQRVVVLAVFVVAFYLPSSLAFFALPGMSIAWHAYQSGDDWRQRIIALLKRADFLLLPFIQFAIFRLFFFKPHASIAGEYQKFGVRPSRLQEAFGRIQADILLDMPWAVRIVLVLLPLVLLLRLLKKPPQSESASVRRADLSMFLGLCACFFALLPYLAVGRLPVFSDWNSRYHLFLPLGYALVCWSICLFIASYTRLKWVGAFVYALLLVLGASFSIQTYVEYADDWRKQQELMALLKIQSDIKPTHNIVLLDSIRYAKRRVLRHNEYTQMMVRVQPAWNGLALSNAQLQSVAGGSLRRYVELLGGIDSIQADPKLFGFANGWRWNDSCIVLIAAESEGRVQLQPALNPTGLQQPCVLPNSAAYK
jgi:hypothetical protein